MLNNGKKLYLTKCNKLSLTDDDDTKAIAVARLVRIAPHLHNINKLAKTSKDAVIVSAWQILTIPQHA